MTRLVVLLAVLGASSMASAQERNTDRPGGDYRNFEAAPGEDYRVCERACQDESRCRAWSFVRPRTAGGRGQCWLKSSVPGPTPNPQVDSGVKGLAMARALPLPRARVLPGVLPARRSAVAVRAETGEVRNTARTDLRPTPHGGVTVLQSFSLAFSNGDHKIRRLGVLADGRFARFAFADQDSNDPFRGEGRWFSYPDGVEGEVHGTSRSRAVVEIPAGPAGHTLVLRGFEVSRADGTDANVRTLGVTVDGDAREVTVVLSDDMRPDWRGFEATAGIATLLAFLALDPATALAVSGTDALSRLNHGLSPQQGAVPGRPYAFTVQYAWIPDRYVIEARAMAGTEATQERHARERPADLHALQGFSFSFGNSDHHLERVAIDLTHAGTSAHSLRWPPPVFFHDYRPDDPMQWAIEYVTLREN